MLQAVRQSSALEEVRAEDKNTLQPWLEVQSLQVRPLDKDRGPAPPFHLKG